MPTIIAATLRATILVTSLAVVPAFAQDASVERALRWFDSLDVDRDGFITIPEIEGISPKQYGRMDGDGDDALTLAEFNFGVPADRQDEIEARIRRFELMDRDADGVVTAEENQQFNERIVELADADGDGRASRDEFAAAVGGDDQAQ